VQVSALYPLTTSSAFINQVSRRNLVYAQFVLNFTKETIMSAPEPTIQSLYGAFIFDLTKALALKQTWFANGIIQMIFGKAARRALKQHMEWQV
jgi:hypothetical protein